MKTKVETKVEDIRAEVQSEDGESEWKRPGKRNQVSNVEEQTTKRIREELPQLPNDVLVRVIGYASVIDIINSRLVCRQWRKGLWEVRCNTMGLLPPDGNDSVLHRAANNFGSRIHKLRNQKKTKGVSRRMKQLYGSYYFTWAFFNCKCCRLSNLHSLLPCFTKPCDVKWIDLNCSVKFLNELLDFEEWTQRDLKDVHVAVDMRKPKMVVSTPPCAGKVDEKYTNPFDYDEADCIFASRDHFEKFCVDFIEGHYDHEKYIPL